MSLVNITSFFYSIVLFGIGFLCFKFLTRFSISIILLVLSRIMYKLCNPFETFPIQVVDTREVEKYPGH